MTPQYSIRDVCCPALAWDERWTQINPIPNPYSTYRDLKAFVQFSVSLLTRHFRPFRCHQYHRGQVADTSYPQNRCQVGISGQSRMTDVVRSFVVESAKVQVSYWTLTTWSSRDTRDSLRGSSYAPELPYLYHLCRVAVSYTHLTLPTIYSV